MDIDDFLSDKDKEEIKDFIDKNMICPANQKIEKYYIAYIDLLGMKAKMTNETDECFCNFANQFAGIVDSINSEINSRNKLSKEKIEFHMFSDNMIFLCKNFHCLFDYIALLQRRIIIQLGIFMSGIIDYGSIYYYKDRFILGSGLVSAYDADSTYHHPAIKVGRNIEIDKLKGKAIKRVGYDEVVIDYLTHSSLYDRYDFLEEVKIHEEIIKQNLLKYKDKENIYSKYRWLKEYHNSVCKKMNLEQYQIK